MDREVSTLNTFVLLSLGANLNDRLEAILLAVELLQSHGLMYNVTLSSVYETEPVGYRDQPSFLNCSVSGFSLLQAKEFHSKTKKIEQEIGRLRREKWHEREIDIDILMFGNEILDIPHPRMNERRFVLVPTAEIAPNSTHPLTQKTMQQLLNECTDTSEVLMYKHDNSTIQLSNPRLL
jgi:2-amino-4-hydroxy-6-hydroxymethyldihydropteridine diphosphokinase